MAYRAPPLHERIILKPGEHTVVARGPVLQTLLRSCVAACLYDEAAGLAGMNHFLLANRRYAKDMPVNVTEAGRYGIQAMELLINDMLKRGADKRRLKAKAFGAGRILESETHDNFLCISDVNARFIREFLDTEGIPLLAEDLGGELGRVIHFHTENFSVFRRYIAKTETVQIEENERHFWSVEIQKRDRTEGAVFLFGK